jgi:hypothetical protein
MLISKTFGGLKRSLGLAGKIRRADERVVRKKT